MIRSLQTKYSFPDDEGQSPSPRRRRVAGGIGCFLVIVIVTFIVWFIATHAGRTEPDGTPFGRGMGSAPPVPMQTAFDRRA